MSGYIVGRVQPLRGPGEDEARRILQNIADDVEPLLRRHRWTVSSLEEFNHRDLYGRNSNSSRSGRKIELRLREHGRFLPYSQVLGIMLHELAHCGANGHGRNFRSLRDQLHAEWRELQSNGSSSSYGNYSDQYGSSSSYGGYTAASNNPYGSSSAYGHYTGETSDPYGSYSSYGNYTGESSNQYGNYSNNHESSSYNYNYDTYNQGSSSYNNNHGSSGCVIM